MGWWVCLCRLTMSLERLDSPILLLTLTFIAQASPTSPPTTTTPPPTARRSLRGPTRSEFSRPPKRTGMGGLLCQTMSPSTGSMWSRSRVPRRYPPMPWQCWHLRRRSQPARSSSLVTQLRRGKLLFLLATRNPYAGLIAASVSFITHAFWNCAEFFWQVL
jgi:hypothetical protein